MTTSLPTRLRGFVRKLKRKLLVLRQQEKTSPAVKVAQVALVRQWQSGLSRGEPLPAFNDAEFRCFSQNGEDGLLLHIFALVGAHNKTCVEICAGDGIQCNSANLILNHGWRGMLVDGNPSLIEKARDFYTAHPDSFSFPPKIVHAWIDRESINQLISTNGFAGEIDLLSIDLDGIDYWIWEALEVSRPRVVVAEVQCIWGSTRSVTVPYRRDFQSPLVNGFGVYSGASLPAFVKLAKQKGYRLIGMQDYGFNAFFMRDDVGQGVFPEVSAETCLDRPFVHWAQESLLPLVKDREWIEV